MGSVQSEKDCPRCKHVGAVTSDYRYRSGEENEFCSICGYYYRSTLTEEGTYTYQIGGALGVLELEHSEGIRSQGVYYTISELERWRTHALLSVENTGRRAWYTYRDTDGLWYRRDVESGVVKDAKSDHEAWLETEEDEKGDSS